MDEPSQQVPGAPATTGETPNAPKVPLPQEPQWPALGPVELNAPLDVFDTSTDTWQPVPPSEPIPDEALPSAAMPAPQFPAAGAAWLTPSAEPMLPGTPGMPSTPLSPSAAQPATPSMPLYPPPPGAEGYAAYPGYFGYSGESGYPIYPGAAGPTGAPAPLAPPGTGGPGMQPPPIAGYAPYPAYAPYPGYPTYPGSMPAMPYTGLVGAPATIPLGPYSQYFTAVPTQQPQPPSSLVRPFSAGLSACLFVGALASVGFVAGTTIAAFRGDWSDGATAAGYTALLLAAVTLFVWLLRILLGRRALTTYVLGGLMFAVLMATGAGSLSFAGPLHGIQAHALERDKAWTAAIHEYALSGESAPNAPNIARVYVEWGEQQLSQQAFTGAVTHFSIVVTDYKQSGAVVPRARQDLYAAYVAWLQSDDSGLPYADAITAFVNRQKDTACDTDCQAAARALEVRARFQYGTRLAAGGDYQNAITQFETIQTKYPKTSYAPQAHKAAAKAYFARGQAQLAGACSLALPDYQTLAKRYADTSEGKQAQAALAAGVDVSGTLVNLPTNPLPALFLSKHIDQASFFLSSEYTTAPDAHGNFTFHHVAPGDYNVASVRPDGNFIDYLFWKYSNNFYFVQVGQLCAVNVGQLSY